VSFNKPRRQFEVQALSPTTSSLSKTRTSEVSKVFHTFQQ
jgi:hypothetical protein